MILVATQAAAHPSAERATAGPRAIASIVADESASQGAPVEPDPTDGRSIIVECVGQGGHGVPNENHPDRWKGRLPDTRLAAPPRTPLGPSECWPSTAELAVDRAVLERAISAPPPPAGAARRPGAALSRADPVLPADGTGPTSWWDDNSPPFCG
jgi:hypothetical protein